MAYVSTAKASPHPPAQLASWVVIPHHVAPNLKLLFPKYFSGTYDISVQIFFDWPIFSNGWTDIDTDYEKGPAAIQSAFKG